MRAETGRQCHGGILGKLTFDNHADSANELMSFYIVTAKKLRRSKQWFMAAVSLAFAVEASVLAYLLVEFGEENGGLEMPDDYGFLNLTNMAKDFGVLNAPIDIPSQIRDDGLMPHHIAKDVIDDIRLFRNLIHPAKSLKQGFDPSTFSRKDLKKYEDIFESILHSLMYHL